MARLSGTVREVTAAMEACQFDRALKALREFAWDVLADNYIELVKGRLYSDEKERDGACRVLHATLDTLCRLMAPFTPYFAEECYSHLGKGSVHACTWPEPGQQDPDGLAFGDLLVRIVAELRRYKHEKGLALNAPMGRVAVFSSPITDDGGDAGRALNAAFEWHAEPPKLEKVPSELKFNMAVIGPKLRKDAGAFMKAARALPRDLQENPPNELDIGGRRVPVPEGAFSLEYRYLEAGEQVDVISVGGVTVTIHTTP